ncbi:hypothetical protein ACRALDRAFT_208863 [Sodiomyces alcalophilus JCM 7366]|uniref:uncharacterized protein n=1 Tax=Sodiomyces alcalophilus JCM 7366 TaxID=591952 RepID=UPI0039B502BB
MWSSTASIVYKVYVKNMECILCRRDGGSESYTLYGIFTRRRGVQSNYSISTPDLSQDYIYTTTPLKHAMHSHACACPCLSSPQKGNWFHLQTLTSTFRPTNEQILTQPATLVPGKDHILGRTTAATGGRQDLPPPPPPPARSRVTIGDGDGLVFLNGNDLVVRCKGFGGVRLRVEKDAVGACRPAGQFFHVALRRYLSHLIVVRWWKCCDFNYAYLGEYYDIAVVCGSRKGSSSEEEEDKFEMFVFW